MNTLKKSGIFLFLVLLVTNVFSGELQVKLEKIPGVVSVKELKTSNFFAEKYLVEFEQYLDASFPDAGTFHQRVFISHKSYTAPVVFITEGYNADYASAEGYVNELSDILQGNQICVEHRYFAESKPEGDSWKYLTTRGSADDHHAIRKALENIYPGKWVSTGISKGGQTCLLYQMYYPEDVDACVAYVAPIATALEDGRHEPFINSIATKKDRKKIVAFQKEMLKRKDKIMPLFEKYVKISKLTFRAPVEEIYEYCVLEYSFAFWQWVGNTERIPSKKSKDSKLFQHLLAVSGPNYFSIEGSKSTLPFFYQAGRELGYYGYETETLSKYLTIESADGYFQKLFLPHNMKTDFYKQTSCDLIKFLQTKAKNTFIIYGEYDPWTAAAPDVSANENVIKIINPRGTHATRIKSLPKIHHEHVIKTLNDWMK